MLLSGPITVNSGTFTITELPKPGISVCDVTTFGYGPPPLSQQLGNALVESADLQTGTAQIIVQPSLATIVTFYNYVAPPAQLKLCKITGIEQWAVLKTLSRAAADGTTLAKGDTGCAYQEASATRLEGFLGGAARTTPFVLDKYLS